MNADYDDHMNDTDIDSDQGQYGYRMGQPERSERNYSGREESRYSSGRGSSRRYQMNSENDDDSQDFEGRRRYGRGQSQWDENEREGSGQDRQSEGCSRTGSRSFSSQDDADYPRRSGIQSRRRPMNYR